MNLLLTTFLTRAPIHQGASAADAYGDAVRGIADRVSWWRFGEEPGAATAVDEEATQNGSYQGEPILAQAPLQADTGDTDMTLGGAAFVEVTHHADYLLANGTALVWFRPTDLSANRTLLSKDASGMASGDLILWYVQSTNQLRFQIEDATQVHGANATGALMVNATYCAAIQWGSGGMNLYLTSGGPLNLVATNVFTGGLGSNTRNLRIGATQWRGAAGDHFIGRLGDVVIWNRALSTSELEAVTQAGFASQPGQYEQTVTNLTPGLYFQLGDANDSSGNGRHGTLSGTGGSFAATGLPTGVGAGNSAFDTEGTAYITIAHAAADVARTNPTDGQWASMALGNRAATALSHLAGYRFVAAVDVSIWFNPQTMPTGANRAVIVAKGHTAAVTTSAAFAESHPIAAATGATVAGGSFEAYYDANGAVHVEVRSFRGRLVRVRTLDGAVAMGTAYHLLVRLNYDGVTAFLNGAQFEDGIPNNQHVFGLSANIRGVIHNNNYPWFLGRAAWGGQADVILDEFAVFHRAPSAVLTRTNINALAEVSSTPSDLGHFIWGQRTASASSFATLQAGVDNLSSQGGGTLQLATNTTYNQDVVLKSGVKLRGGGVTTVINGRITTPLPTISDLGVGSGNFAVGQQTITVNNSASAGGIAVVRAIAGADTSSAAPEANRFDRRWNPLADSRSPFNADAEPFIIESRTSTAITVQGLGQMFAVTSANRDGVFVFNPTSWIGLSNLKVVAPDGSNRAVHIARARNVRITNCYLSSHLANIVRADEHAINVSVSKCTMQSRATLSDPVTGGTTPLQCARGTKDVVFSEIIIEQIRRTIFDWEGHFEWGPVLRAEVHTCEDRSTFYGATNRYGAHETNADCMFWACDTAAGGINPQSWKQDVRWLKGGTDSGISNPGRGNVTWDAGAADAWIRDFFGFGEVTEWFNGLNNVWVKRCRFENVETNDATPGNAHTGGVQNGTGADANTTNGNVDSPHASWVAD